MNLYNLVINEDGSAKVETDLTPQDMQILLTVGLYACMERGVMVKSLADHFQNQQQPEDIVIEQEGDWQDLIDGDKK